MQEGGLAASAAKANGSTSPDSSTTFAPADSFAWKDVSFSVKTKDGDKQILSNVSGSIEKGRQPQRNWAFG